MKFYDTQHFPQKHVKLLNTMFGLSSEQIRYMVQQFDKQYFSTVKLNIDELLKDLCDLTSLSYCLMWMSWRSLKWVHAAWSMHHWICWQNCWHVWVQVQRCNMFQEGYSKSPMSKHKPTQKEKLGTLQPVFLLMDQSQDSSIWCLICPPPEELPELGLWYWSYWFCHSSASGSVWIWLC